MIGARSDVVGSLLRPPELLAARERRQRGEIEAPGFKAVEDGAVDQALELQEAAGVEVVTDGEMRRTSFQAQLVEAVSGFGEVGLAAWLWGDWRSTELGDRSIERPSLAASERLQRRRFPAVEELVYVRGRTDRVVKVTLPSPSLFASFWDAERSKDAYPSLEDLVGHVAELLREEVEELVRLGARYLQIDAPHYPMFVDEEYRRWYEGRGWPAESWLEFGLEFDNYVMSGHPDHVTWAFHLCRGNQMSRWLVEGSYDWLAERLFPRVAAHRLMLEYDDERSGGFEPLRLVPDDKWVVLGLVTTKSGRRETVDELASRVAQAAEHLPLDRLAVSPQCGFATSVLGNELTVDDQRAKLEVLARTAAAVWG